MLYYNIMKNGASFADISFKSSFNQFDTTELDSIAIPERCKNRVKGLFNDLNDESAYSKLSNKIYLQALIALMIIALVVLIVSIGVQIAHPSKYEFTSTSSEGSMDDSSLEQNNDNEKEIELNQARAFINLEVLIFVCCYGLFALIITISIQQSYARNLYENLRLQEEKAIAEVNNEYKGVLEITPMVNRSRVFRWFKCFFVFDFVYHVEIHNSTISQEKAFVDIEKHYMYTETDDHKSKLDETFNSLNIYGNLVRKY